MGTVAPSPSSAATLEPGDATSCFASHARLAASSLESAPHAYSTPWLHISAIETSSEPHAGTSSDNATSGGIEGDPCLTGRVGGGNGGAGDGGGEEGSGGDGAVALRVPAAGSSTGRGPPNWSQVPASAGAAAFEPCEETSCFASHASLASSSLASAPHAYSTPWLHISAIAINSEPHSGMSSEGEAATFGVFEVSSSCLASHAAFPAFAGSVGSDDGGGDGRGGEGGGGVSGGGGLEATD